MKMKNFDLKRNRLFVISAAIVCVSVLVSQGLAVTLTGSTSIGAGVITATPPAAPGPLSEALDTALSFTTGGGANWFSQTTTSFYDGDAAQSGDILGIQDSWMQATVSGVGTVKFYWKVSSEEGYDYLQFTIDGFMQDRISGEVDWEENTYTISTPGLHTLKWRYVKDGSADFGSDCGWVDKVEWVTGPQPQPPSDLSEGLDTPLNFITGGSANWFVQTTTYYYGGDAAQSGDISHNQYSWMQATVSGAGTVKFYWKVSSENNSDFLEFYIDGWLRDRISGEVDWEEKTYTISTPGLHTFEWRYVKDARTDSGNDSGWVDKVEWVTTTTQPQPQPQPPSSLSEGLDTTLNFITGGSANWFVQTTTYYYGGDAAQSGDISHNQDSWMQTTVSGKGTVKFYWKVSSEVNSDFLEFYIDGFMQDRISGSVDWQQKTYTISTPGLHTLEWRYVKDANTDSGNDSGWVDKVEWVTTDVSPYNIVSIGISEMWNYNDPTNHDDLTYEFHFVIVTGETINLVEFLTPTGNTFTIPNDVYPQSGEVETWHFVEGGKHYWGYEASFDYMDGLQNYGDGIYTITVYDADGGQAGTTVLFANPDTGKPIPQPTQEPRLIFPAHNGTATSPVTFTWQDRTDLNATSICLVLTKESTGEEIEFDFPISANNSNPFTLSPGLWQAAFCFDHWYEFNNVDGIPVEVGKYSESDYTFDVMYANLVAHWKMDDNAANTFVVDSSGNANDGTARQHTVNLAIPGMVNGALTFNGSSDYINCGNRSSLDITGSITLSAWINPNSHDGAIISKRRWVHGEEFQYLLDFYNNNLRFIWWNQGVKGVYRGAWVTPKNQWSHVVGTYDADSDKVVLYVNGTEMVSGEERSGLVRNTASVMIGAWRNEVAAVDLFEGAIDQVMIFDRALPPTEVSVLYDEVRFNHAPMLKPIGNKSVSVNRRLTFTISAADFDRDTLTYSALNLPSGATLDPQTGAFSWTPTEDQIGQYPGVVFTVTDDSKENLTDSETITITVTVEGLVSHWPMDDDIASGQLRNKRVVDVSGNGNHGTAQRATHDLYTTGMVNGALTFNGSSDYINCGNRSGLDITGNITLSAWINPNSHRGAIISKRRWVHGEEFQYLFDFYNNNLRFIWWNDGVKGITYDASSAPINQWSHVAGTYDADSDVVTLYVDGMQVASGQERSGLVSNAASVMIGAWRNEVTAVDLFEGAIDQVMIFDRALLQEELATLFWEGALPTPPIPPSALSKALDTTLSFTSGGSANWFAQTTTSYYGTEAAQSGDISGSQDSWMQTTVSGTGTMKFYWKVSSEEEYDYLEFSIDGSLQRRITGEVDWQEEAYTIGTPGLHTLEWRYVKDGETDFGSDSGWVDKVEWVPAPQPIPSSDLSGALETTLNFITGGSASWFGQTTTSYYGGDAAQSGDISHSQDSWMQTTVSGIGTVKFYWSVSSEDNADYLEFYIDGSLQNRISGSVDWQQKTYAISAPGLHTLEWRYVKDANMHSGSDRGWVDKVEWVTTSQPLPSSDLSEALDTPLSFTSAGSVGWFSQTTTSYYGGDAAQSGDISGSQDSWMRTTVSGIGTVTFYWKVSSEEEYDFLEFSIDGSMQRRISGSENWQQETYTISTSGPSTLEWRYVKDGNVNRGSDCGWVDKVEWEPIP
jgi:hypothetical protein